MPVRGMQLLHASIRWFDTFSQYGPGPMIATSAVFAWLPPTLGTADILVSCFNLVFFIVLLFICRLRAHLLRWSFYRSAIISVLLAVGEPVTVILPAHRPIGLSLSLACDDGVGGRCASIVAHLVGLTTQ